MTTTTFTEFRKNASLYFSQVENGETVVVLRHGKAIAEIVPPRNGGIVEPAWKNPGLRLIIQGAELSKAILQERDK
ncbi:type II toxin-antitoxin system Phd/YefM family antitoxin [candidate division KSB1 bacterium]|nr:type II toxin-antitoxin system Phd/YefM family antitoxin [candidate division KSB1 bacterium]RQW08946.1 MAG: type II toxin-antitoxin system Phd/YefM family antitoxin [candidate division KSB1 bacterium]